MTNDIRLTEVADGVWLAAAAPRFIVNSNAVIVRVGDDVVVVDTHREPRVADQTISLIRRRIRLPVSVVVNTHAHWDHWHGNGAYARAFPGVSLVASGAAVATMTNAGIVESRRRTVEQELRVLGDRHRGASAGPGGSSQATWRRDARRYLSSLELFTPVSATVRLGARMEIVGSGRTVSVIHLGRAHTDGDLIVHVFDQRIVAAGDVVNGWVPFMDDAYPEEWIDVIAAIEQMAPSMILPGHGAPLEPAWLSFFRSYIIELVAAARQTDPDRTSRACAEAAIVEALAPRFEAPFDAAGGALRPWRPSAMRHAHRVLAAHPEWARERSAAASRPNQSPDRSASRCDRR